MLHDVYVQNHKSLKNYFLAIDTGELPIERGVILNGDDIIRRTLIMELMCQFQISPDEIQEKYHLSFDCDFAKYFFPEQSQLQQPENDGLIRVSPNHIEVTPSGRGLIRNSAALCERYLCDRSFSGFSRAI